MTKGTYASMIWLIPTETTKAMKKTLSRSKAPALVDFWNLIPLELLDLWSSIMLGWLTLQRVMVLMPKGYYRTLVAGSALVCRIINIFQKVVFGSAKNILKKISIFLDGKK
jgi:hypothetical protein